ncbi:acetyl-CoA acetyltransferase [Steroidobacter cummioxidans]|uniref:acetyl-CoA acetyltransferase n=1 Tax=Steroidobacter cummioxidans TaxID=1803913 RepID=UPI000E322905|nr:acetyl-CoA acetyltransferase [Steroidobacter cummioxidans]
MTASKVFVLGGAQTDFARNWARDKGEIYDMLEQVVLAGLSDAKLDPGEIQSAHIGNFASELFCRQGQLGGLFARIRPEFNGLATMRHEAACASGSMALLSAAAEIEAGRYDLVCVVGIEMMRNVSGRECADYLGTACWSGHEFTDAQFVWPRAFSDLGDEYERRYGLDYRHLGRIAQINYDNGRRNPHSQTRSWKFNERSFTLDDEANPVVEGRVRRNDCGQITDGAAVVFLASARFAERYMQRVSGSKQDLAVIRGWGHRTATMRLADKFEQSKDQQYVLPHLRSAITDAFGRAGVSDVGQIDVIETHDCFAVTEYAAIDHFGITAPGQSWRAVEDGSIEARGRIPINPSGGLIGLGHPVGATGVRMMLDAWKQVAGRAGEYQVEQAKTVATMNLGGSATSVVSFVVGTAD